jgi:uncharacterized protein
LIGQENEHTAMTEIIHDPHRQCFSLSMQSTDTQAADKEAVLEYTLSNDGVIDFNRTYVPFSLRGKGLAEALVEEGLGWARQEGYVINASCWYVQKFLA